MIPKTKARRYISLLSRVAQHELCGSDKICMPQEELTLTLLPRCRSYCYGAAIHCYPNAGATAPVLQHTRQQRQTLRYKTQEAIYCAPIARLEEKLIRAERHSRGFNVRLLGAREVAGDDYIKTVENILRDQFALTGNIIENAHRTGRPPNDNPRHIIARFSSRVTQGAVMRGAQGKLANTNYRLIEDLTQEDVKEKTRIRP